MCVSLSVSRVSQLGTDSHHVLSTDSPVGLHDHKGSMVFITGVMSVKEPVGDLRSIGRGLLSLIAI